MARLRRPPRVHFARNAPRTISQRRRNQRKLGQPNRAYWPRNQANERSGTSDESATTEHSPVHIRSRSCDTSLQHLTQKRLTGFIRSLFRSPVRRPVLLSLVNRASERREKYAPPFDIPAKHHLMGIRLLKTLLDFGDTGRLSTPARDNLTGERPKTSGRPRLVGDKG